MKGNRDFNGRPTPPSMWRVLEKRPAKARKPIIYPDTVLRVGSVFQHCRRHLAAPVVIVTFTFWPVTRGCGWNRTVITLAPSAHSSPPQCKVLTWSHEARFTPGSSCPVLPILGDRRHYRRLHLQLSQEYILHTDHSLAIPRHGFLRADINHVGGGGEGVGLDLRTHACNLWLWKLLREKNVAPKRGRE